MAGSIKSCIREGSGWAWLLVALVTILFWCPVIGYVLVWWLRNYG